MNSKLQLNPRVVVGIALFAIVGTIFILATKAATPTASIEAESGTRTANVTTVSDATASGSQAVQFSNANPSGGTIVVDDFNGSTLDTSVWTPYYYWPGTEYGLDDRGDTDLPEQVTTHDGFLDIWAHRQATADPTNPADIRPYRSGVVTTGMTQREGKPARWSFKYGLIEFRAKVPVGRGYQYGYWTSSQSKMWPAIWLLAANGKVNDTTEPEIDMLDMFGDSTYGQFSVQNGTIIPGPYGGEWSSERINNPGSTLRYNGAEHWDSSWSGPPWPTRVELGGEWHTWALNWTPTKIEFLFDGKVHGTVTDRVPQTAYYLLVNMAVGHQSGFWPIGSETPDDAHLLFDWVRLTPNTSTVIYRNGVAQ